MKACFHLFLWGCWLLGLRQDGVKRSLDVMLAGAALLLLWPVMLVIAWRVWAEMGLPVLFRQERPGYKGTPFLLLKFRTMRSAYDDEGRPLPDSERLTPYGAFLRRTSLDELPELINILRGEMSFVGPRPLLMDYLPLYSVAQARRHEVRPGLTGWAQVNGRNAQSWEERFAYDLWYVEKRSLLLDLRILLMTVLRVMQQDGTGEMERFEG